MVGDQLSLEGIIRDVGEEIQYEIDSFGGWTSEITEWMREFGIDAANDPKRTTSNLAVFNRLLKISLYNIYRDEGAELERLSPEKDIYSRLVVAHAETGDEAFRESPLDGVIEQIDSELFKPLFDAAEAIIQLESPTSDFGELFENLVEPAVRRKWGQFHTPKFIGQIMASWAVDKASDVVLDPGIGAGVLTSCVYEEKRASDGSARVDEMWGVDVSALAIVMASTGLKIEDGKGSPNFLHCDYLDTLVEGSTARISQTDPKSIPKVDAIVSNPPYSRSHALEERRKQYNRIVDSVAGLSISGQAPLYAYFLAHSEQFLKEGGRLAFITSSRFFDTIYGEDLRRFLLSRFAIDGFVFLELDEPIFDDADVTPCITLLRKQSSTGNQKTSFVRVNQWPGVDILLDFIERGKIGKTSFGFVNRVNQQELSIDLDWRHYTDPNDVDQISGLKKFEQIADIKRGIATGRNDYFCLNESEVREWGIDEKYLSKLLRRTSEIPGVEVTNEHWEARREAGDEVWLLYCYNSGDKITQIDDPSIERYLEYGREIGANESYLAANRKPWYVVDKREPPDILATYMSQVGFRFIRNRAKIRTLNNLHNIYLDDFHENQLNALLAYLNSSVADRITKHSSRIYARGLHKIEPNELKAIPVIDPMDLADAEVERLADAFNQFCNSQKEGRNELHSAKTKMDKIVKEVLGLAV